MTQNEIVKTYLILIFDLGRLCLTYLLQVSFGRGFERFKQGQRELFWALQMIPIETRELWFVSRSVIKNKELM